MPILLKMAKNKGQKRKIDKMCSDRLQETVGAPGEGHMRYEVAGQLSLHLVFQTSSDLLSLA